LAIEEANNVIRRRYHLIKLGHVVRYRSIFDVVRDFLHDEAMDGHERIMASYLKPDLLIIDDFGMKQLPKRSGEFLFEIVMRCYETRSTMMTTNRPIEDWGKLLGDVPTATAILDRFLHHSEIISITGQSYRLRNRSEGSKPAKAPTGSKKVEKDSKPAKSIRENVPRTATIRDDERLAWLRIECPAETFWHATEERTLLTKVVVSRTIKPKERLIGTKLRWHPQSNNLLRCRPTAASKLIVRIGIGRPNVTRPMRASTLAKTRPVSSTGVVNYSGKMGEITAHRRALHSRYEEGASGRAQGLPLSADAIHTSANSRIGKLASDRPIEWSFGIARKRVKVVDCAP
jgi:hypothetical protein